MHFHSFVFVGFFIAVYTLYLIFVRRYRWQNVLLLVASLVFYGYWDWRFLGLIAFSTLVDYFVARGIHRAETHPAKRRLLAVSLVSNLGTLGFFKYFNFFADNVVEMLNLLGMKADPLTLEIILPVGISFYTFQAMSYTIDVYRGQLEPRKNFIDVALFIAFFPQLVAGPIERAKRLLPQVENPRKLEWGQINAGLFLILWGYVKKVVIADNMAQIANPIFDGYAQQGGADLLIGALAFTYQIYGDFSGYSDIARGLAKLLGFELMVNFRLPYFALNPSDFWLRWHVSLSSWLRDYLYIPLGGNRGSTLATYRNLALTMLLGGLWHGAAWNFVIWGAFHGAILILYRLLDRNPEHEAPWSGKYSYLKILVKMALMYVLTVVGWIIFRSTSATQVWGYLSGLGFDATKGTFDRLTELAAYVTPLVALQIWQYVKRDLMVIPRLPAWVLVPLYTLMLLSMLLFGVRESIEFIYFQF